MSDRWAFVFIIAAFVTLTFVVYWLNHPPHPVNTETREPPTERDWERAETVIDRRGNLSEITDIMGEPDDVERNVSNSSGTCYLWKIDGRYHGALIGAYDAAIGTCIWVRKP